MIYTLCISCTESDILQFINDGVTIVDTIHSSLRNYPTITKINLENSKRIIKMKFMEIPEELKCLLENKTFRNLDISWK
jgi:uncharacterized NAD-dependent epimerase/dehydratase family protein